MCLGRPVFASSSPDGQNSIKIQNARYITFVIDLEIPVQCKQDHHKNCWDCSYAQAKFLLNNQRSQKSRGAHKSNNSRDQDVFLTARVWDVRIGDPILGTFCGLAMLQTRAYLVMASRPGVKKCHSWESWGGRWLA